MTTYEKSEPITSLPLTSSAVASPVRTCPPLERELALLVLRAAYGSSSPEWFLSYDPLGLLSRTSPAERVRGSMLSRLGWNGLVMRAYRSRLRRLMSGAPHRRARVFIVAAHANAKSQSSVSEHAEVASSPAAPDAHETVIRNEQGRSSRPGRPAREAVTAIHGSDAATDSDSQGLQGTRTGATGRRRPPEAHWRSPQPEMVRVVSRLPRRLDSPSRRIAALGNSVVPQCAQVIGHLIQELAA